MERPVLGFPLQEMSRGTALIMLHTLSKGQQESNTLVTEQLGDKESVAAISVLCLRQAFLAALRLHSPENEISTETPKAFTLRAAIIQEVCPGVSVCPRPLLLPHPNPWLCCDPANEDKSSQQRGVTERESCWEGPVTSQAHDCDKRWSFTKTQSRIVHLKVFILYNSYYIFMYITHTNMHTNILFKIIYKIIKHIQIYHYIIY